MSRVDLGQVTLNTRIDGEHNAPWLVLSNSLGSNLTMWDAQMGPLVTRFRVLRYDTRGHGGSDAPPGPYSFADLEGDVLALMDHLEIETCAFMGLSMGAMTGIGLGLAHPDRFERMVLADGRADAPDGFRAMWDDRIAKVEAGGLEAIADGTLASWLTEDWRESHPDETAAIRDMITGNDPAGYIACCRAIRELDYLKDLPDLKVPALYVVGSEDKGAAPEVMEEMAKATPDAQFKVLPGAGHVANINAPQSFNAAIAPFLGL